MTTLDLLISDPHSFFHNTSKPDRNPMSKKVLIGGPTASQLYIIISLLPAGHVKLTGHEIKARLYRRN